MGNQNKFCLFCCCCVKHIEKVNYTRARISDHGTICVVKKAIFWLYIDVSKKSFVHV